MICAETGPQALTKPAAAVIGALTENGVMHYCLLSVVPVVIVIVLAVATRRAFESILAGTLAASLILYHTHFITGWTNAFLEVAGSRDNQWILLMCGLFGSLVALLTASKGTRGFKTLGAKICRTARSTRLTAFVLGVIIYIDDYLNMITVGTCMQGIFDRRKISRESLAYIMDSTGTPVCVLLPFSTWAAFYGKLFLKEKAVQAIGITNEIRLYTHIIPYAFYAILTVLIVFLFCAGVIPAVGMMKTAEERSKKFGNGPQTVFVAKDAPDDEGKLIDFVVPLLALVVGTLAFGDIFPALILSICVCGILYIPRRRIAPADFGHYIIKGFCDMVPTLVIVLMALLLADFSERLGMSTFVIEAALPLMTKYSFPAITFAVVAILCFATSSTWGLSAIVVPVILPLAADVNANLFLVMGAILSGSTFGSHACFYSDATVLAASSAGVNNMDHALTQLPYALIAAGISLAMYVVAAMV